MFPKSLLKVNVAYYYIQNPTEFLFSVVFQPLDELYTNGWVCKLFCETFCSTTFAQDQSSAKTATLDTIVVTASRSEEKLKNVPARLTVIDQKTIEKNPALNLSDLIQRDPSVFVKQRII